MTHERHYQLTYETDDVPYQYQEGWPHFMLTDEEIFFPLPVHTCTCNNSSTIVRITLEL